MMSSNANFKDVESLYIIIQQVQKLYFLTQCSLCHNILEKPQIIGCDHVFCLQCLNAYLQVGSKALVLKCPICETDIQQNEIQEYKQAENVINFVRCTSQKVRTALGCNVTDIESLEFLKETLSNKNNKDIRSDVENNKPDVKCAGSVKVSAFDRLMEAPRRKSVENKTKKSKAVVKSRIPLQPIVVPSRANSHTNLEVVATSQTTSDMNSVLGATTHQILPTKTSPQHIGRKRKSDANKSLNIPQNKRITRQSRLLSSQTATDDNIIVMNTQKPRAKSLDIRITKKMPRREVKRGISLGSVICKDPVIEDGSEPLDELDPREILKIKLMEQECLEKMLADLAEKESFTKEEVPKVGWERMQEMKRSIRKKGKKRCLHVKRVAGNSKIEAKERPVELKATNVDEIKIDFPKAEHQLNRDKVDFESDLNEANNLVTNVQDGIDKLNHFVFETPTQIVGEAPTTQSKPQNVEQILLDFVNTFESVTEIIGSQNFSEHYENFTSLLLLLQRASPYIQDIKSKINSSKTDQQIAWQAPKEAEVQTEEFECISRENRSVQTDAVMIEHRERNEIRPDDSNDEVQEIRAKEDRSVQTDAVFIVEENKKIDEIQTYAVFVDKDNKGIDGIQTNTASFIDTENKGVLFPDAVDNSSDEVQEFTNEKTISNENHLVLTNTIVIPEEQKENEEFSTDSPDNSEYGALKIKCTRIISNEEHDEFVDIYPHADTFKRRGETIRYNRIIIPSKESDTEEEDALKNIDSDSFNLKEENFEEYLNHAMEKCDDQLGFASASKFESNVRSVQPVPTPVLEYKSTEKDDESKPQKETTTAKADAVKPETQSDFEQEHLKYFLEFEKESCFAETLLNQPEFEKYKNCEEEIADFAEPMELECEIIDDEIVIDADLQASVENTSSESIPDDDIAEIIATYPKEDSNSLLIFSVPPIAEILEHDDSKYYAANNPLKRSRKSCTDDIEEGKELKRSQHCLDEELVVDSMIIESSEEPLPKKIIKVNINYNKDVSKRMTPAIDDDDDDILIVENSEELLPKKILKVNVNHNAYEDKGDGKVKILQDIAIGKTDIRIYNHCYVPSEPVAEVLDSDGDDVVEATPHQSPTHDETSLDTFLSKIYTPPTCFQNSENDQNAINIIASDVLSNDIIETTLHNTKRSQIITSSAQARNSSHSNSVFGNSQPPLTKMSSSSLEKSIAAHSSEAFTSSQPVVDNILKSESDKPVSALRNLNPRHTKPIFETSTPQFGDVHSPNNLCLSPIVHLNRSQKKPMNAIEKVQGTKFLPLTVVDNKSTQVRTTAFKQSTLKFRNVVECRKPTLASSRLEASYVRSILMLERSKLVTYSKTFSSSVTHMVVDVDENNCLKDHTIKFVAAVAAGIWVVNIHWVEECLKQNRLIPEESFEILDVSGIAGPRISRLTRLENPLFKNFKIHVQPAIQATTQKEIEDVILMLGGQVVAEPEQLMDREGKICLAVAECSSTQHFSVYDNWLQRYKFVTVDLEWLSSSVGHYKVMNMMSYLLCSDDTVCDLVYPMDLVTKD